MSSERLTAFTDGVVAVIITILVLEMKPPHEADFASLATLGTTFLSFALSFAFVAIYWNNHHHLFRLTPEIDALVMWANLGLLFWLSLIPFATAWMDEHSFAPIPIALYGVVLFLCGLSWWLLQAAIIRLQGPASPLRRAVGRDLKGKLSTALYLFAVGAAFVAPLASYVTFVVVAAVWLAPDRRVAALLAERDDGSA